MQCISAIACLKYAIQRIVKYTNLHETYCRMEQTFLISQPALTHNESVCGENGKEWENQSVGKGNTKWLGGPGCGPWAACCTPLA